MPSHSAILEQYTVDSNTGCWNWTACINDDGYGQRSRKNGNAVTTDKAHRLFYEQHNGPIPDGMVLDHKCRNRSCVNPDHLEPVTNAENVRRGKSAKLTVEKVAAIRSRYAVGDVSQLDLANEYCVSERSIQMIVTGQSWTADIETPQLSLNNTTGRPAAINEERQREVARRFYAGERNCDLAREFGISPALVCRYVKLFPLLGESHAQRSSCTA